MAGEEQTNIIAKPLVTAGAERTRLRGHLRGAKGTRPGLARHVISCGAKSDEEVFGGGCTFLFPCLRASGVLGSRAAIGIHRLRCRQQLRGAELLRLCWN